MKYVKIYPSFIVLFIICLALGYIESFFVMFLIVTTHEIAHIIMATVFKVQTIGISFTPFGEIAELKDVQYMNSFKKILIFLAGPFANLLFIFIVSIIFPNKWRLFLNANLAILLFNILPVYPLDGGRILHVILGNLLGVLNSNIIMYKLSKIISFMIVILGFVQLVLFPYNISLICIGVYLFSINKKEFVFLNYEFYKTIMDLNMKISKSPIIKVKTVIVSKETKIKTLLYKLSWDYFCKADIIQENKIVFSINEMDIMKYVMNKGINGNMDDIILFIKK